MLEVGLIGVALCVALAVWAFGSQADERSTIRASLEQLGDYEITSIRDQELLPPLRQRAIKPVTEALTGLGARFTPSGYVDNIRRKLTLAGMTDPDTLDRFLAVRVLTIAAIPVWMLFSIFVLSFEGTLGLASLLFVPLLLFLGPDAILNRRVEERQHAIRVKLPDILDLLVISVEAGLGFEQALDRTTASVPGPLSDEFVRMLGEVRAGSTRAEAMRALDNRIGVTEIRSFVLAILQADTFGVSIGRVLRSQADEMRIRRRQLAQEEAQKAPVKMMIPMVFCIFPALFAVVLGPAVINIYENFS
ncbi:MAG TPA: type II secretion system F family protein [Acidimicrobiales bacterium]|jgi:tight adherence protein C